MALYDKSEVGPKVIEVIISMILVIKVIIYTFYVHDGLCNWGNNLKLGMDL